MNRCAQSNQAQGVFKEAINSWVRRRKEIVYGLSK
jgi:hypothetical protein